MSRQARRPPVRPARFLAAVLLALAPGFAPGPALAQTQAAGDFPAPALQIVPSAWSVEISGIAAAEPPAAELGLALPVLGSLGSSARPVETPLLPADFQRGAPFGAKKSASLGFTRLLRARAPAGASVLVAPSPEILRSGVGARSWAEASFAELAGFAPASVEGVSAGFATFEADRALRRGSVASDRRWNATDRALRRGSVASDRRWNATDRRAPGGFNSVASAASVPRLVLGAGIVLGSGPALGSGAGNGVLAAAASAFQGVFGALSAAGYVGGNLLAIIMNFPQIYTSLRTGHAKNLTARTAVIGGLASLLLAVNAAIDQRAFFGWQNVIGGLSFLAVAGVKVWLDRSGKSGPAVQRGPALAVTLGIAAILGAVSWLAYEGLAAALAPAASAPWLGPARIAMQLVSGGMFVALLLPQNAVLRKTRDSSGVSKNFVWSFLLGSLGLGLFALHRAGELGWMTSGGVQYLIYSGLNMIYIASCVTTLRLIKRFARPAGPPPP